MTFPLLQIRIRIARRLQVFKREIFIDDLYFGEELCLEFHQQQELSMVAMLYCRIKTKSGVSREHVLSKR